MDKWLRKSVFLFFNRGKLLVDNMIYWYLYIRLLINKLYKIFLRKVRDIASQCDSKYMDMGWWLLDETDDIRDFLYLSLLILRDKDAWDSNVITKNMMCDSDKQSMQMSVFSAWSTWGRPRRQDQPNHLLEPPC